MERVLKRLEAVAATEAHLSEALIAHCTASLDALGKVQEECGAASAGAFLQELSVRLPRRAERWVSESKDLERQEAARLSQQLHEALDDSSMSASNLPAYSKELLKALRQSLETAAREPMANPGEGASAEDLRGAAMYLAGLLSQAQAAEADVGRVQQLLDAAAEAVQEMEVKDRELAAEWREELERVRGTVLERLRAGVGKMSGLIAFVEQGLQDYHAELGQMEKHDQQLRAQLSAQAFSSDDEESDDGMIGVAVPSEPTPRRRRHSIGSEGVRSNRKASKKRRRKSIDIGSPVPTKPPAGHEKVADLEDVAKQRGKAALKRERRRKREQARLFEAACQRKEQEKRRRLHAVKSANHKSWSKVDGKENAPVGPAE